MDHLKDYWQKYFATNYKESKEWNQKKKLYEERKATIVRIDGHGHIMQNLRYDENNIFTYLLYLSFLIQQKDIFYKEERVIPYTCKIEKGNIVAHTEIDAFDTNEAGVKSITIESQRINNRDTFIYDRRAAVQYAERWWNSYNPKYEKFSVDCTNYVSQCLFAGNAPMSGAPIRERGWWYQNKNWSFSWSVAHSLRWYLSGSIQGLKGKELERPEDLIPGDIICYDFEGDDRWDHNTIVVKKDANNMPLVNAHTNNSRNRYWAYEDSMAWTPNIQYKFFRIGD